MMNRIPGPPQIRKAASHELPKLYVALGILVVWILLATLLPW